MKNKKQLLGISILLIGAIICLNFYQKIYTNNIVKQGNLYIKSTDDFTALQKKIAPFLKNTNSFNWVADQKKFTKPKGGRYVIENGMSNNDLVNLLRIGNQKPIKVSFNNQDTLEKFAQRIASQLEADSLALMQSFTNESFLKKNDLDKKTVLGIFIPNSYELYWNTSADKFRDKMLRAYQHFWNSERQKKASELKLSKKEVITLASIVQKETAKKEERPIVAGLYLNRLKNGWPLQADPTIIYCIKEKKGQNYAVKRVLTADLELNSPYNTYKYKGLPPSLISMPDPSAIDAVLNATKHNYFYMCASTEKIGYHVFAKTLSQHNRNAVKYHQWMNNQGINR